MRIFGVVLMVLGGLMFVAGMFGIYNADSAVMLAIARDTILGIGGIVLFVGGAIIRAVMSLHDVPVDEPLPPAYPSNEFLSRGQ